MRKQKNLRRWFAGMLAVSLVAGALTACGSGGSDSSSGGGSADSSSAGGTAQESAAEASADESTVVNSYDTLPGSDVYKGETNQQTYPISEEKITLRVWNPHAGSLGELADWNDSEFWQWYEEKTNIHIEWITPAAGTESQSFQLLFASDDMPDIIYFQPVSYDYPKGEDKAIEDGYFINMAEYLDCAPNYVSWLNSDETWARACFSDAGNLYGFWGVWDTMDGNAVADQGLAIRQDFLEAVGKDVPTTYEEWEDVLVAFRDELGIEAPFYTSQYGIDNGEFMAGYGVGPYFYLDGGEVKFGPMEDGYLDYLTMMNRWWSEGLLDRDFATRTSTGVSADNDMMLNDKVGSLVDYGTRLSDAYVSRGASNENFWLVACPQPKLTADGADPAWRLYKSGSDNMTGYVSVINAESEYIEEAIRWVDGFYAEDVFLNANYGIESEEDIVWYAAEDGHRIGIYDFRYSNPNGLSSATVLAKYWAKNPPVRVEASQIEQMDEVKRSGYTVWSQFEPSAYVPNRVTMSSEESTEYASLYADIESYVQECNVKFIMGQMDLADYDSYRDSLTGMGIERCIELWQAAYDRYGDR